MKQLWLRTKDPRFVTCWQERLCAETLLGTLLQSTFHGMVRPLASRKFTLPWHVPLRVPFGFLLFFCGAEVLEAALASHERPAFSRDAGGRAMPWKVLRRGVPSRVLLVVNATLLVVNGSVLVVNATLLVVNGSVPLCFNHGATFFELHKQNLIIWSTAHMLFNGYRRPYVPKGKPKALIARAKPHHREYTCRVLSARPKWCLQRSSLPPREYACRGPFCPPEMMPAEVLSATSLPTQDDACSGPLCRPESIPAEVLSAHPR